MKTLLFVIFAILAFVGAVAVWGSVLFGIGTALYYWGVSSLTLGLALWYGFVVTGVCLIGGWLVAFSSAIVIAYLKGR